MPPPCEKVYMRGMRQSCASTIFATSYTQQSLASTIEKVYMRQRRTSAIFAIILHTAMLRFRHLQMYTKLQICHFCNNTHFAQLRLRQQGCTSAFFAIIYMWQSCASAICKCRHAAKRRICYFCNNLHAAKKGHRHLQMYP